MLEQACLGVFVFFFFGGGEGGGLGLLFFFSFFGVQGLGFWGSMLEEDLC